MLVPVEISSFAIDFEHNTPVILLRSLSGVRTLPIPVGPLEASAIALKTMEVDTEQPLTIDLTKTLIDEFNGRVEKVIIHDIDIVKKEILAKIFVILASKTHVIECRPSDAISLSLRCGSPIFVAEQVFDKIEQKDTLSEKNKLKENIATLDTLAFGICHLE